MWLCSIQISFQRGWGQDDFQRGGRVQELTESQKCQQMAKICLDCTFHGGLLKAIAAWEEGQNLMQLLEWATHSLVATSCWCKFTENTSQLTRNYVDSLVVMMNWWRTWRGTRCSVRKKSFQKVESKSLISVSWNCWRCRANIAYDINLFLKIVPATETCVGSQSWPNWISKYTMQSKSQTCQKFTAIEINLFITVLLICDIYQSVNLMLCQMPGNLGGGGVSLPLKHVHHWR